MMEEIKATALKAVGDAIEDWFYDNSRMLDRMMQEALRADPRPIWPDACSDGAVITVDVRSLFGGDGSHTPPLDLAEMLWREPEDCAASQADIIAALSITLERLTERYKAKWGETLSDSQDLKGNLTISEQRARWEKSYNPIGGNE
jgi:hypothetical protein